MRAVLLGAWALFALACTSSSDPAVATGPDCAKLSATDTACLDATRTCHVDADCVGKVPACSADGQSSLVYGGAVCESGNCGYSITATPCACSSGACPGGSAGSGGAGGAGGGGGAGGN